MRTMPDSSYETGSPVAGARVYTWNCVNGEHVVIWQVSVFTDDPAEVLAFYRKKLRVL